MAFLVVTTIPAQVSVDLALDQNEAEAIHWFLKCAMQDAGYDKDPNLDPTSLAASAIRVVNTLAEQLTTIRGN